jgi:hypothetical protein
VDPRSTARTVQQRREKEMKADRGFWWLFETDDEDEPAAVLIFDLAGRRAPVNQKGARMANPTTKTKRNL